MNNDSIRTHCLSLPHVTEVVRWGEHLLFKVGGKMFAIIDLDGHSCSVKCAPETYAELVEMEDIVPSSHNMWKHGWVTLETLSAVPDARFRELLYRVVRSRSSRAAEGGAGGAGCEGCEEADGEEDRECCCHCWPPHPALKTPRMPIR